MSTLEAIDSTLIERQLISCVLIDDDGTIFPQCMQMGVSDSMFTGIHQSIWGAMVSMFQEDEPIEAATIHIKTGIPLLSILEIENLRDAALTWKQFAVELIDLHLKKQAIRAANIIVERIDNEDTEAIVSEAIGILEDRPVSPDSETSVKHSITGLQDRIKQRNKMGSIIKTGISNVDDVVKIHGGQLITVAARPGGGKTSELIQMAFESGCLWNASVDFYTLEMATDEVLLKGLACMSGVSINKLTGEFNLPNEVNDRIKRAADKIANSNIHIHDNPDITADIILATSKQRQATGKLDAIFVDYVQIMNPRDPRASRVEQVSQMTRDLKKIAKRLDVPVIIAAQLNRDLVKSGRKPRLSDLRESGSIEQDSDIVLMIHPKKEIEDDPNVAYEVEVELMVEKHRNGPTFYADSVFRKTMSRFNNKTTGGM